MTERTLFFGHDVETARGAAAAACELGLRAEEPEDEKSRHEFHLWQDELRHDCQILEQALAMHADTPHGGVQDVQGWAPMARPQTAPPSVGNRQLQFLKARASPPPASPQHRRPPTEEETAAALVKMFADQKWEGKCGGGRRRSKRRRGVSKRRRGGGKRRRTKRRKSRARSSSSTRRRRRRRRSSYGKR
jgi:hypothetical protein